MVRLILVKVSADEADDVDDDAADDADGFGQDMIACRALV